MTSDGAIQIHGHAVVSADDRIADRTGRTPDALRSAADWRRFQAALDAAAVTVLGRLAHEANPNPKGRRRLILSGAARGLEERADGLWWNPALVEIGRALRAAAPAGGIAAIVGGRRVFDLFLAHGYHRFDLVRAEAVRLGEGTLLFSGLAPGRDAAAVLAAAGLRPEPAAELEPGFRLTIWRARLTGGGGPPRRDGSEATGAAVMDEEAVLGTIPLFAEVLDPAQRAALAARCRFAVFPAGAVLTTEGEFGTAMYALTEGTVAVAIDDPRRGTIRVATLGPGDLVGEMALMTGARRSATVTAATPVTALEISKVALEGVFARAPELIDRLAVLLEARQAELDRLHDEAGRWTVLGLGRAEIAARLGRLFGRN